MNFDPTALQQVRNLSSADPSLAGSVLSRTGSDKGGGDDDKTKKPFPLLAVAGIGLLALLILRSK